MISRLLLEKPPAVGAFSSIADAETWVRKVLAYKYFEAKQVAGGLKPAAYLSMRFGSPTGREAYLNQRYHAPAIRDTFSVFVYIYHEPRSPNGFVVHTAYPRNIDPMKKSITSPIAFYRLTAYFADSYIAFADDETFVRFAYQQFMRDDPDMLDELLDFLRRVLRMKLSAKQLEDILKYQSSAHSYGMSGDLHQLFSLMLEIGEKEAKTGRINEREALPLHLLEQRKTQPPLLR
ncbi:hypothetical protein [Rhizobium oryzicola]|uniref:Uncharacterized protein n=1 Tax=Rhizobium oryzicola TaxID=1232668 RepID=A0ABT8T2S0_9HYPH|nr:hypothetical protein [Rhizobium oryzicola]MDO1585017.1 hypothetical protein [Rhizobium oryzicola]